MKAAVIKKYGGNEALAVRDMPLPSVGSGDVLIRVHAASVNPVDWKIRDGIARLLTGAGFPKILGCECAGEVAETGIGAKRFAIGDKVIGFPGVRRLAAFAEFVSVSQRNTFRKPEGITYEQASTIPVAGLTALQALRDLGRIAPGQNVLINGASGGVGTFAVQIGKILGATVTAVCSGQNADLVRGLGADFVIDYTREDFTRGDELYDVIFDAVSKRSFNDCKRSLAPKGIYVNTLPSVSVLLNQYLAGFLSRRKAGCVMVRPNAEDMEWMRTQIEAAKIRIVVDRVYSLEQIREAFAYSETGKAKGKVVIDI